MKNRTIDLINSESVTSTYKRNIEPIGDGLSKYFLADKENFKQKS